MRLHSNMRIAVTLPQQPGKVEVFAGEEIQKYLSKIFGNAVSFVESGAEIIVVIGGPDRNTAAEGIISATDFAAEVPGPEGFFYAVKDNTILLAGSDETGTLYAAYEFLEKELGCCFASFPVPDVTAGEVVPTYAEKQIADIQRSKAAADIPYRTAIVQFDEWVGDASGALNIPFFDYLAKNRYNRILTWIGVYQQLKKAGMVEQLQKRGIRLTVGHHQSLTTFLPFEGNEDFPTPYAKEHPEFFRVLVDGRRLTTFNDRAYGGQWLMCSRSQGAIEEMATNINTWLEQNPVVDTIALWPNDGVARQCQCGLCAPYTKMENYLYFLNEVAKRLKEMNEERRVDAIIYLDLWDCPKNTQLCENIVIDISTWTPRGLRSCGKPDGSSLLKSDICKQMHAYRNTGCPVVLYEYYMGNYGNKQAVMPSADELQSIFRYFKENGFEGSGTQMETFNLWNNLLNFYCFARTAYDTEFSLEQGIEGLCHLFGKGAEPIAKILRIYEDTLDGQVAISETGRWFAANVDAPTIYALFEEALQLADDALTRNNVRLMRMAFHYTMLLQVDTEEAHEELGAMATHFDSFKVNEPGYGISIDTAFRSDKLPDDKWYQFEK